ncbi:TetR family transcriptional regulator [Pseudooceanicola sp. CBS1P-1]|nr:TetR family transcriptional regulator [Pseudooceanicola endophyticus]
MREEGATRANGDRTKKKILDAAEDLFGARGMDSVSLRDITDRAEVTLALASYHFRTKDRLFEAVVARRADVLCALRRTGLEALPPDAPPQAILDAFMRPLFEQITLNEDPGWAAYMRVLARMGEDDRWLDLLGEHFDALAREFIARLRQALPDAPEDALARAFTMTLHLMLTTVSRHRRLDQITGGRAAAGDLQRAYDSLLAYAAAGITAASDPRRSPAAPLRSADLPARSSSADASVPVAAPGPAA